jgi:hypothetical protein
MAQMGMAVGLPLLGGLSLDIKQKYSKLTVLTLLTGDILRHSGVHAVALPRIHRP